MSASHIIEYITKIIRYLKIDNERFLLIFIFIMSVVYLLIQKNMMADIGFSTDEKYWVPRSYQYIESLKNFDLIGGVQSIHPGITVMTISGIIIHLMSTFLGSTPSTKDLYDVKEYFIAFNIPIYIFVAGSFFWIYRLLKKAEFNSQLSLLIMAFLSSNYYFVFETTPVDKFAVISFLLSTFCLLSYFSQRNPKKYLYLSSFFAVFSIFSKLSGLIFLPLNLLIIIIYSRIKKISHKRILSDIGAYIGIAILSSVVIYPGLAVDPFKAIQAILGAGNNSLIFGMQGYKSMPISDVFVYYTGFLFIGHYSPIASGLLLSYLIFFMRPYSMKLAEKKQISGKIYYINVAIITVVAIFYFGYTALFAKAVYYRYMIPAYSIAIIASSIAAYELVVIFRKKYSVKQTFEQLILLFILLFYSVQYIQLLIAYIYILKTVK